MSEFTRLAQALIDEPLRPRPTRESLQLRSARRQRLHQRTTSFFVALALVAGTTLVLVNRASQNVSITPPVQLASYFVSATNVPDFTLDTVGLPAGVAVPGKVPGHAPTVSGRFTVSYVGARYCPYCALQRWALLVALSKFGTFTHLDREILSSSSDVFPHLASWSFQGARYSSSAVRFLPVELTSTVMNAHGQYAVLGRLGHAQRHAMSRLDPQGEIPFVEIGGAYYTLGASASPAVLEGLSVQQIGDQLVNPASAVALAVDGAANYLIGAMCQADTGQKPNICTSTAAIDSQEALATGVSPATSSGALVQPPFSAPLSVWKRWSDEMHVIVLRGAASMLHTRDGSTGCTITNANVTGRVLTKPLLGIPAGVEIWAISLQGVCPHP
ncbi:MAG TPA: DUF929 family protein [Acidimicrobiales bacterium]|nr:DUF929 family protein [Acidimicrobiales bacterium]